MGRTVNRRPQLIETPSSKAITTSYFHQNEWKGICEDKNTFGVDQNTFAECENVYVNRDNFLCNRPGLNDEQLDNFNDGDYEGDKVYSTKSYVIYFGTTNKIVDVKQSLIETHDLTFPEDFNETDLYFYEIGNILFAFGNNSIYKLQINLSGYSFVSAMENLYIPADTDVINKFIPDAYVVDQDFTAADYSDILSNASHYESNDLKITVSGIQYNWPYSIDKLKYGMLYKTTVAGQQPGYNKTLIVNNGEPYILSYSGTTITLTGMRQGISTITCTADYTIHKACFEFKSLGKIYFICGQYTSTLTDKRVAVMEYDISTNNCVTLFTTTVSNQYTFVSSNILRAVGNNKPYFFYGTRPAFSTGTPPLTVYIYDCSQHTQYSAVLDSTRTYDIHDRRDWEFLNPQYGFIQSGTVYGYGETSRGNWRIEMGYSSYSIQTNFYIGQDDEYYVDDYYMRNVYINFRLENTFYREYFYAVYATQAGYWRNVSNPTYTIFDCLYDDWATDVVRQRYFSENVGFYTPRFIEDTMYSITCTFFGRIYDVFYDDVNDNLWVDTINGVFVKKTSGTATGIYQQNQDITYKFSLTMNGEYDFVKATLIRPIASNSFLYFVNDTSYILQVRYNNENIQLYIPDGKENKYYDVVIDAEQTSDKSLAVIGNNVLYSVIDTGEVDDKQLPLLQYIQSKLNLRVIEDSDSIIAYNSSTLLMPTYNGIAAVNYSQLISVEEQTVNYITDNVLSHWFRFIATETGRLKTCNHNYYLLVYHTGRNDLYMFDYRTNTWWYWTFDKNIKLLHTIGLYCFIVFEDNTLHYFDEKVLDAQWSVTSQKLFLGNNTNYKQMRRFTVHTVGEESKDYNYTSGDGDNVMDLQFTNYRKRMYKNDDETFNFNVDFVRTYVIRLNYPKVYEFQYKLSSNELNLKPLQLTGITIEYKVGGKVR